MSNFLNDTAVGTLLDSSSLAARTQQLPTVRKGGVDPDAVGELVKEAAALIDTLNTRVETLETEASTLAAARDEAVSDMERAYELLSGEGGEELETVASMKLLENARRVAAETIQSARSEADDILQRAQRDAAAVITGVDAARSEADDILNQARNEARALITNARSDAESEIADLREQIAKLRDRRDAERVDLDNQLNEFRHAATEAHRRATGSLQAALTLIEEYVAGHSETDSSSPNPSGIDSL